MGVDVSVNFGVGFEVTNFKTLDEDYKEELDNLFGDSYEVFVVGSYYSEDNLEYYVTLPSLKPIDTLEERANELKNLLLEKELIDSDGEFNLVGGELWW